jgi:hypothetical protein
VKLCRNFINAVNHVGKVTPYDATADYRWHNWNHPVR